MFYVESAATFGACSIAYDDFMPANRTLEVGEATGTPTMKFFIIHSYYFTLMAAVAVSPMYWTVMVVDPCFNASTMP